jgi:hypothetical protein
MELTDPELAVLWHLYDSGPREPIVLFDDARNAPPPPLLRGQLSEETVVQALADLIDRGLAQLWSEEALEAELARWDNEPLPRGFGVDLDDLDVGWADLTKAGWRFALDRWGRDRRFTTYDDSTLGVLIIYGESPAACMTERDLLTYKIDHGKFYTYGLVPQPGPVTSVGQIENVRGWWYNRFHLIRPGYSARIEYTPPPLPS